MSLLETSGNTAYTWIWNYNAAKWSVGKQVLVIHGSNGKFLRSNADNKLTDNLEHLIDLDWIMP